HYGAVRREGQAPHLVCPRHGQEESFLILAENQAVGARDAIRQLHQHAVGKAVDAAARIGEVADALVGEVEIAARIEDQVVDALEALLVIARNHGADPAVFQNQNSVLVVGNEDSAVAVNRQTVRLAVVFGGDGKFALRGDLENATESQVDHIKVPIAVK